MAKSKWTTILLTTTTLLTELASLATTIYLIQLLNGNHQRHQQDLLSLITGKAYESPAPTPTISSATPKPEPPNPLDVLATQFDGLPLEAQQTAMREYGEYMSENGMWKQGDPRVPEIIPGQELPLQWSEPPLSPS
jgi:hypothetical protein